MSEALRALLGHVVRVHIQGIMVRGRLIYHQDSCHAPNHRPELLVIRDGENLTILRGWEQIEVVL